MHTCTNLHKPIQCWEDAPESLERLQFFQINNSAMESKLTGSLIIEWNLENKFSPREMIPLEFWSCLGLISDTRYPIKASKRPRQHSLEFDLFRRFFSGVCSLNDRLSLKSRTHDLSDLNSDHQPLPKLFLANKFRAAIFSRLFKNTQMYFYLQDFK